jgi:hypothetical protein
MAAATETTKPKVAVFVKRSAIAIPPKGRLAGPLVSITEGGVMGLSVAASKALNGVDRVFFRFYPDSRKLELIPKGHKIIPKDYTDADGYELKVAKKSNSVTVSGSNGFLQDIKHAIFPEGATYQFRASGNQTFDASTEGGMVSFTLPLGKLQRKEVVKRKPRAKKGASASASTEQQVNGAENSAMPDTDIIGDEEVIPGV